MDDITKNSAPFGHLGDYTGDVPAPSFDRIVQKTSEVFQGTYAPQLESFKTTAPGYLWNNIASELHEKDRRRALYYWYAAAGLALLIISGTMWRWRSENATMNFTSGISSTTHSNPIETKVIPMGQEISAVIDSNMQVDKTEFVNNTISGLPFPSLTSKKNSINNKGTFTAVDEIAIRTPSFVSVELSSLEVDSTKSELYTWEVFDEEMLPQPEKQENYLLANLGGFNRSYESGNGNALEATSAAFMDNATSGGPVTKKTPITFGFDFRKQLNSKFSLNTGIQTTFQNNSYAFLTDYSMEESNVYFGVPLELLVEIKSWENSTIQIHLGHLQEILIHSTQKYDGVKEQSIPLSPQLGVTSGISLDRTLYKGFGISGYLGAVSYYLKPYNSYYTDQRIYPNLKFSFRYKF